MELLGSLSSVMVTSFVTCGTAALIAVAIAVAFAGAVGVGVGVAVTVAVTVTGELLPELLHPVRARIVDAVSATRGRRRFRRSTEAT